MNPLYKTVNVGRFLTPLFNTPDGIGNWFGYYNYDPLNYANNKMLCQRVNCEEKEINANMQVECGYYDIPSGAWHHIGYSDLYNWPQGCMIQWIPDDKNREMVIYNRSKNHRLISTIHDVSTGEDRDLEWPIYGITPDGNKSITLNFERSYWCRAYHYYSVINRKYDVRVADDDGVFEIDLAHNTRRRIISILDVIEIDKEPYFDNAKHWLEHIMISPNGKRFCFLHRFSIGNVTNYETRLFIANIDGSELQIVKGWRDFSWSHFGWNGDDAFAIYAYNQSPNERLKKIGMNNEGALQSECKKTNKSTLIRSIYHALPYDLRRYLIKIRSKSDSRYQYYVLDNDCHFVLTENFNNSDFLLDGHPSFTSDGQYMITDTYPDLHNRQHLLIYNIKKKKVIELASVKAIVNEKCYLCDLHPKLSKNNNYLMIDVAYANKHHMMLFQINWDQIKDAFSKGGK